MKPPKQKKTKHASPAEPKKRAQISTENRAEAVGDLTANAAKELPGRGVRWAVTILILAYLVVLVIGPLSNPIASQHLMAPLARGVAPIHRALFLGHGYRFFAPNPSSSHLVQYKITRADGTQVEGVFPDRDSITPRLLYHRWFMLSETVFAEHARTPSPREFEKLNRVKKERIETLRAGGKLKIDKTFETKRLQEQANYQRILARIDVLVRRIARFLIQRDQGEEIELTVVTRTLPFPDEVRQGIELNDKVFLQYEANPVIGRFLRDELLLEELPTAEQDAVLLNRDANVANVANGER